MKKIVKELMELEVPWVGPRGRPRKQWNTKIEEDLREMNLRETDVMNRDGLRTAMELSNPVALKRKR